MADTIEKFFQELEDKGHQPLLGKVRGTVRFDLANSDRGGDRGGDGGVDHWRIAIDRGDIMITNDEGDADCTLLTNRAMFERLITGEENAIAAILRGAVECVGNVELLFVIYWIFRGPPRKRQLVGEAMES